MPGNIPEWTRYACQIPNGIGSEPKRCLELTRVHHVVHVRGARRILEDGAVKAGLIYDESRLNRSRLCVSWLSANTWAYGSIYGNVQFTFAWSEVIADKRVYWVEAMKSYKPPAYRLLLTDRDLAGSKHVQSYDPRSDDGPLKRNGKTWYWNSDYTSEFMVEGDLPLQRCREVTFIRHHDTLCRPHGSQCADRKAHPALVGGRILAFVLGNALHAIDGALTANASETRPNCLNSSAEDGIAGIWRALGQDNKLFKGGTKKPSSREALVRGALALHGSDQTTEARKLLSLLSSKDDFENALTEVTARHFGFSSYEIPA